MRLKTLQQIILYRYRQIFGYGLLCLFTISFGWWRLASVARGFSPDELHSISGSLSWTSWLHQPIAPLTHGLQWVVIHFWGITSFGLRSVSVALALIALLLIGLFIFRQLGRTIAVLAGTVIVTSFSWLILTRQATYASESLLWLSLSVYCASKLHQTRKDLWWLAWCISLAGLSYNQAGIWAILIILAVACLDSEFRLSLRRINLRAKVIGLVIYAVLMIPLIYASAKSVHTLTSFLGLDAGLTPSIYLRNLLHGLSMFFLQVPSVTPYQGITGRYVFYFSQSALVLLGLLALIKYYKSLHHKLTPTFRYTCLILLAAGVLISGLSSSYISRVYILFPTIIFVACGLWMFLTRWNTIFPRNPYARTVGLLAAIALVTATVIGNYQLYFRVWAFTPATSYAFSDKIPMLQRAIKSVPQGTCNVVLTDVEMQKYSQSVPYLFGKLSSPRHCQANLTTIPDPVVVKPQIISIDAWNNIDYYTQQGISKTKHVAITNSYKDDSLGYWVFLP